MCLSRRSIIKRYAIEDMPIQPQESRYLATRPQKSRYLSNLVPSLLSFAIGEQWEGGRNLTEKIITRNKITWRIARIFRLVASINGITTADALSP